MTWTQQMHDDAWQLIREVNEAEDVDHRAVEVAILAAALPHALTEIERLQAENAELRSHLAMPLCVVCGEFKLTAKPREGLYGMVCDDCYEEDA